MKLAEIHIKVVDEDTIQIVSVSQTKEEMSAFLHIEDVRTLHDELGRALSYCNSLFRGFDDGDDIIH